jgi:hypothetical protein
VPRIAQRREGSGNARTFRVYVSTTSLKEVPSESNNIARCPISADGICKVPELPDPAGA